MIRPGLSGVATRRKGLKLLFAHLEPFLEHTGSRKARIHTQYARCRSQGCLRIRIIVTVALKEHPRRRHFCNLSRATPSDRLGPMHQRLCIIPKFGKNAQSSLCRSAPIQWTQVIHERDVVKIDWIVGIQVGPENVVYSLKHPQPVGLSRRLLFDIGRSGFIPF